MLRGRKKSRLWKKNIIVVSHKIILQRFGDLFAHGVRNVVSQFSNFAFTWKAAIVKSLMMEH